MEGAPLTLAHAHARKASHETARAKLTNAAIEHEFAAEEFAKAADTTNDTEALRMLKLLEEHHHRLADIINTKDVITKQLIEAGEPPLSKGEAAALDAPIRTTSIATDAPTKPHRSSGASLSKIQQQRREASPALAKDIASRRGIPQPQQRKIPPPILDSRSALAHTSDPPRKKASSKHREIVEAPSASQAELKKTSPTEDGFSRFYSNLTSGPFSKISSMLAFAALPLTETPSQPSSPTSSRTEKTSARAHNEPDFKNLISPAAMNALEEHQRRQGNSGQVFGPGESFYVVPPSGGTASYANIMRNEQRYARRQQGHLSNISEEDGEFVDARETQHARNSSSGTGSGSHGKAGAVAQPNHRAEELQMENDTLKQVLDTLSHRLQAFERSAQDASMAALTQSMASVRTAGGGRPDEGKPGERDHVMEDELQRAVKEITKLKGQNQKYKDYLDRLKSSARQKTKEKKESGEGGPA